MKKSTKGALAAGAAAVLLLGGAGSLAYWTGSADVDGGQFTTGNVSLNADDCSTADWTYASGGVVQTGLVPGDTITKDCTVTVTGTGDHLYVALDTPGELTYTATDSAGASPTTLAPPSAPRSAWAGRATTPGRRSPFLRDRRRRSPRICGSRSPTATPPTGTRTRTTPRTSRWT